MTTYRRTTTDHRHALPIDHLITAESPAAADTAARRRHVEQTGAMVGEVRVTEPLILAPRWGKRDAFELDMRSYQP